MNKTFKHSGDIGDIIYSLPVIKKMGGGILFLNTQDKYKIAPKSRFDSKGYFAIKDLLSQQDYIKDVIIYIGNEFDVDLDVFRIGNDLTYKNLAETMANTFGYTKDIFKEPWLKINEKISGLENTVLFNRTNRYLNCDTDWKEVFNNIEGDKLFIGLESEWKSFCNEVGQIDFAPTENLLQVSQLIYSAKLFIGNQSSPYAIAEGLKKDTIQFVCKDCPNCIFERDNAKYLF